jgi:hypothetical protein
MLQDHVHLFIAAIGELDSDALYKPRLLGAIDRGSA